MVQPVIIIIGNELAAHLVDSLAVLWVAKQMSLTSLLKDHATPVFALCWWPVAACQTLSWSPANADTGLETRQELAAIVNILLVMRL